MESSIHDVSKNPTQIQTRNDTETFTDLNTTGKSPINFLKWFPELKWLYLIV